MSKTELERNFRVIDMMLTMHSVLRDRNKTRAFVVDIVLLALSVIICVAIFLDPRVMSALSVSQEIARIILGVCSIVIFFIGLVTLRVDWKEKAEKHNQACQSLIRLKAECREILESNGQVTTEQMRQECKTCARILSILPKIPESKFNQLKSVHVRKVELSKIIDKYPRTPLFLIRLSLFFRGLRDLSRKNPACDRNSGKA